MVNGLETAVRFVICASIVLFAAHGIAESPVSDDGIRFYLGVQGPEHGDIHRFGEYPLEVGNTWTYKNTYKSCIGTSTDIVTITWMSEVTVREHDKIPEGTMVLRQCDVRDVTYDYPEETDEQDLAWFRKNIAQSVCSHYLVFGSGCVEEVPAWGWDNEKRKLADAFRERLEHPDFPKHPEPRRPPLADLVRGELPAYPDAQTGYWWRWAVLDTEDVETPAGLMKDAVHLLWMANGGGRHRYFENGVGYVKDWYQHGGSYFEDEQVLVRFERRGGNPSRRWTYSPGDSEWPRVAIARN